MLVWILVVLGTALGGWVFVPLVVPLVLLMVFLVIDHWEERRGR